MLLTKIVHPFAKRCENVGEDHGDSSAAKITLRHETSHTETKIFQELKLKAWTYVLSGAHSDLHNPWAGSPLRSGGPISPSHCSHCSN